MPNNRPKDDADAAIAYLVDASRTRPIVPFLGSGLSYAAGFPTIRGVIQYLAKLDFAIQLDVYKHRYPQFSQQDFYQEHPGRFVEDFGWPSIGELNSDLWDWLNRCGYNFFEGSELKGAKYHDLYADLLADKTKLDYRDHLRAIVQWSLRRDLTARESGAEQPTFSEWQRWKGWYLNGKPIDEPWLLDGDWDSLLDRLCEADLDLIDSLFTSFERGRRPTLAHRYLAFLIEKLGIPLVFTTNFDSFLERAMIEEGHEHRVFDVHRDATLPHASLVRKYTSILKLHGSAYGLRVGERLQYPVESQTRESMLDYIPKEALLLVTGFSGSERRMLQILKSLATDKAIGTSAPRMLWLEGPGKPKSMLEQFRQEVGSSVMFAKITDISTFLQQLFFHLTGGYQASRIRYAALPGRPSVILKLPQPLGESETVTPGIERYLKKDRQERRRPVQIFVTKPATARANSWGGLAVAEFVSKLAGEYNVIWIDLEKHHTISGTVSEILQKAMAYNPDSPQFTLNFNLMHFDEDHPHDGKLTDEDEINISKAVDRIREVFKQGKYLLVLDSVESYGRPQLQHHGVPSFRLNNLVTSESNSEIKKRLERNRQQHLRRINQFDYFLAELLVLPASKEAAKGGNIRSFYDSYICLSADCVVARHGQSAPENDPLTLLLQRLRDLDGNTLEHVKVTQQKQEGYGELAIESVTHESYPESKLGKPWNTRPDGETSVGRKDSGKHLELAIARLRCFLQLRRQLVILQQKGAESTAATHNLSGNEDCRDALLAVLSIFRRPRSIACVRSITERWGVESGTHASAVNITGIRQQIDKLIRDAIIQAGSDYGMLHEGGSLWLYREVHLTCYKSMTESLSASTWAIDYFNQPDQNPKAFTFLAAQSIVDGLISVSLHIDASRVYYADTFMPTKDLEAFYEYLYHRCWAIRALSLLIAILREPALQKGFERAAESMCDAYNAVFKLKTTKARTKAKSTKAEALSSFNDVLAHLGVFSSLSATKEERRGGFENNCPTLLARLGQLRNHCLQTLHGAFARQELFLRTSATADTLKGWIDQILDVAMPEMNGSIFPSRAAVQAEAMDNGQLIYVKLLHDVREQMERIRERVEEQRGLKQLGKPEITSGQEVPPPPEPVCVPESTQGTVEVPAAVKAAEDKEPAAAKRRKEAEKAAKASQDTACFLWTAMDQNERPWNRYKKANKKGATTDALFQDARQCAIDYEVAMRESVRSEDEDARHRSCALALLARSEYLVGHFRQAHHHLDLASAGLTDSAVHSVSRSLIHTYRAELLIYSADAHYERQLTERQQKEDRPGPISWLDVRKELRKVDRADREIRRAVEALRNAENMTRWRCLAHLGVSQVQLERLLFQSEVILVGRSVLAPSEFSEQCGQSEKILLDGLRNLRSALELLPYISDPWKDAKVKHSNTFEFKVECKVWSLWRQFYVSSSFFEGLLATYYRTRVLTGRSLQLDGDMEEILSQIVHVTQELKNDRWKLWNTSVRFDNVSNLKQKTSNDKDGLATLPSLEIAPDEINKHGAFSLRKVQTLVMAKDMGDDKKETRDKLLERMWDFRRPPTEAGKATVRGPLDQASSATDNGRVD
ncbi:MAG: hypothetical protein JWN70_5790 [Planctomycetaceae bacterium]|nr:hypothetical protein [Planctomycetaceae bacterium]